MRPIRDSSTSASGCARLVYENLAGTNQVHRAILTLLEPTNFEAFMKALTEEVAQTLQEIDGVLVARVHIVMPYRTNPI